VLHKFIWHHHVVSEPALEHVIHRFPFSNRELPLV
jgi:hypothetical protein